MWEFSVCSVFCYPVLSVFIVLQSTMKEKIAGCFTLIVFLHVAVSFLFFLLTVQWVGLQWMTVIFMVILVYFLSISALHEIYIAG